MNWNKIEKEMNEVQKGKRTRLLSIEDVKSAIAMGESKLASLLIPKKYWEGSIVRIVPPKVSNSYKYPASGVQMRAIRMKTTWQVTFQIVRCGSCPYGDGAHVTLELSIASQQNIPVYRLGGI